MGNLEKEIEIKKQLKLAKIFKSVISTGLIAPVFISASDCKKKAPAIKEVEETIHG